MAKYVKPQMVRRLRYCPNMAIRLKPVTLPDTALGHLARNLEALMRTRPELKSQPKVAAKAGISQSSVGRMFRAEASVTMGHLEAVAHAFGCEPWQLLVPQFDPHNPPRLLQADDDKALLSDWYALAAEDRMAYRTRIHHLAAAERTPLPDEKKS